jgi:hypothetical protein
VGLISFWPILLLLVMILGAKIKRQERNAITRCYEFGLEAKQDAVMPQYLHFIKMQGKNCM